MKARFSKSWIKSTQPRKQRKYRAQAPLHIRQKYVHVHLSKDLRQKYKKRSVGVRKGDIVKILRGQFRKKSGKVDQVDVKRSKMFVEGIERVKRDGTKTRVAISPSNGMLTELNVDDKKRIQHIERK